jgi:hypothetical protein
MANAQQKAPPYFVAPSGCAKKELYTNTSKQAYLWWQNSFQVQQKKLGQESECNVGCKYCDPNFNAETTESENRVLTSKEAIQ